MKRRRREVPSARARARERKKVRGLTERRAIHITRPVDITRMDAIRIYLNYHEGAPSGRVKNTGYLIRRSVSIELDVPRRRY